MIIVSFFNAISIVCCSQVMTSMGEEPVSEQEFQDFAKVVVTHSQYSCIFYALVFPFAHPVTSDFGQISGPSARCRWITGLRRWELWFLASFKSDVQFIFDVVLQGFAPLSVIEEMLFIVEISSVVLLVTNISSGFLSHLFNSTQLGILGARETWRISTGMNETKKEMENIQKFLKQS